jgi:hypothetical protein
MADPVDPGAVTWLVLVYQLLAKPPGPEATAAFNAARDRDSDGVITGCREGAEAVEAMIAAGDFRHGQLPEYDSGLKRLDTRRRAIGERDLLGARRAQETVLAVARYRSSLDNYARGVLGGGTGYLLP